MHTFPFTIDIADSAIDDLRLRLEATRWPDDTGGGSWAHGTPLAVVQTAVEHWRDRFDWRRVEKTLNALPHFIAEIDGEAIHYLHFKSAEPGADALVITHGWPGSFVEMLNVVPMLTHPSSHGLPGHQPFDVVVPSLPGFGFSPAPRRAGMNTRAVAALWHALMTGLGYSSYFAQGGDIGAGVSSWLARLYPNAVRALHLNFVPGSYQPLLGAGSRPLSNAESAWLAARKRWLDKEGGYSHLQGTKPQTLAYALTDSPVGLAAWILEKFEGWSDGDGGGDSDGGRSKVGLFTRFSVEDLLTNISIYWFSGTVASTLRMYKENAAEPLRLDAGERIGVPLSFAAFPKEIVVPPREWVERGYNLVRWTEMPSGGHFAALERPNQLARDIHASFQPFRMSPLAAQ